MDKRSKLLDMLKGTRSLLEEHAKRLTASHERLLTIKSAEQEFDRKMTERKRG
jgi:hypothetical protein